jgi:membrane fusion protein (multidrug efflux system)
LKIMTEKALKIVTPAEAKKPHEQSEAAAGDNPSVSKSGRHRLRVLLLIVLPLLAVLGGLTFYLLGGRYISTDNAFVGAQKVLITPDISGKIVRVAVIEGQYLKPGDELFTLDPEPYRLALAQAKAKLDAARSNYDKLKTNLTSLQTLVTLAQQNVDLKKREVARKSKLLTSQAGSQADVDTSGAALVAAQLQAQFTIQQRDTTLSQLLGNPDLPLAQFPEYAQAQAALGDAERNLDHTTVRAPMSGTATQVDNIQLGRFVAAGTPILSVIDDSAPWVDANPKETDITYLRVGQKVAIDVDSFPDHTFKGTVSSVSPGTGAQFSILPAQNASGNWVKVVQRVPVRITFDKSEDTHLLRSGMSVNVEIDTGHSRLPFMSATASEKNVSEQK